jgi:hypothetical protein
MWVFFVRWAQNLKRGRGRKIKKDPPRPRTESERERGREKERGKEKTDVTYHWLSCARFCAEQKVASPSDSSPCAVKRGLQSPPHPHSVSGPHLPRVTHTSITPPPNDGSRRSSPDPLRSTLPYPPSLLVSFIDDHLFSLFPSRLTQSPPPLLLMGS